MSESSLAPRKLTITDLIEVVAGGWRLFLSTAWPSLAFSATAVCIGYLLLTATSVLGITPMTLPLAGGFMLMAPAMLSGFFRIVLVTQSKSKVRLSTPFAGFIHASPQIWVIAVFCAFVFMIWLTDAGILYSFTLGQDDRAPAWLWFAVPDREVAKFWFWGSLMGGFLACVIFAVTAFSVPLLCERRATLIRAINASVRAVFHNWLPSLLWGLALCLLTVTSVLLLPLLLILLPVLSYASFLLYLRVFPAGQ